MGGKYKIVALSLFVLFAFVLGVIRASGWDAGWGFRLPDPPEAKPAQEVAKPTASSRKRRAEDARKAAGRLDSYFASSRLHTQVHAASLVELRDGCTSDTLLAKPADCGRRCSAATPAPEGSAPPCPGRIRAFWFSGSREGAADVTINSAMFDSVRKIWGAEQVVTGRAETQRGLHRYIAKVGNPVAARGPDGDLWLFYVTVSLGGWAGSSITLMTSKDEGQSWSAPRRLVTSPFINISTLVKAPPFLYADGTMGLPVYHEFITKFAEILRLDSKGNVLDKQRLAAGGQGTLQPVVLVRNKNEALALTRHAGDGERRVVGIASEDGGRNWNSPKATELKNPDAALTALVMADGNMLAVLNDTEHGRASLSLQLSADGGNSWRELRRLEEMGALNGKSLDESGCLDMVEILARGSDARLKKAQTQDVEGFVTSAAARVRAGGGCSFEFSYPYMIQASNGDIHVAYTWNRTFIKHLVLDQAWLQRRIKGRRP